MLLENMRLWAPAALLAGYLGISLLLARQTDQQLATYSISKSNVDAKAKHGQYGRTASEADKVHV